MGRSRSKRLDRLEHFFGDIYSREKLNKICFGRLDKGSDRKEVKEECRAILSSLGYETTAIMSGGRTEYEIRYK